MSVKRPYKSRNTVQKPKQKQDAAVSTIKDTDSLENKNTTQMQKQEKVQPVTEDPRATVVSLLQEAAAIMAQNSFLEAGGWLAQVNRMLHSSNQQTVKQSNTRFESSENPFDRFKKKTNSPKVVVTRKVEEVTEPKPEAKKESTRPKHVGKIDKSLFATEAFENEPSEEVKALVASYNVHQLLAYAQTGNPQIEEGHSAEFYAQTIIEMRKTGLVQ
jgi:hypothetical protein